MGDTSCPLRRRMAGLGRSVTSWTSGSDLSPALLEGETMAPLCAEFGISRKTSYKIFDRYKDCGLAALTDRSRRPFRRANRLPAPIEARIVRPKREYPGWGTPKIREKLRQQAAVSHLPAISTVHAVLDRHGLIKRRRRRLHPAPGTALSRPTEPNALMGRRRQRRIHARRLPLLLPPDHHRFREPVPPHLWGAVNDAGRIRLPC